MNTVKMRFLLIEDHGIVRLALKEIIRKVFPGSAVTEIANKFELDEFIGRRGEADIIILDIKIRQCNPFTAIERFLEYIPSVKILVFSQIEEGIFLKKFFKSGIKGYLNKEATEDVIIKALLRIAEDKTYISENLKDLFLESDLSTHKDADPFEKLTQKEFAIMLELIKGKGISEISNSTNLHTSSIGTYKKRIFEKCQVDNILKLIELAKVYNIVD
jgi:DNA-binding NarL/FixJ family response regulator